MGLRITKCLLFLFFLLLLLNLSQEMVDKKQLLFKDVKKMRSHCTGSTKPMIIWILKVFVANIFYVITINKKPAII